MQWQWKTKRNIHAISSQFILLQRRRTWIIRHCYGHTRMSYKELVKKERMRRGLFLPVEENATPRSPGVPVVIKDPKNLWPCIHRGTRLGDTPCGGCGGKSYVEVFGCEKHKSCTVSKPAKDKRIHHCAGCPDRNSGGEYIDFASLNNKFAGKTALIVGRGRTSLPDEYLSQHDGPILFINDAALLEKHAPYNPHTFMFAQDSRILPVLDGLRSTAVLSKGSDIGMDLLHGLANIKLGKVVWTIKTLHGDERYLGLTRDQIAIEKRLYRAKREVVRHTDDGKPVHGPSPTIASAIHFAWYIGCENIKLMRCDGLVEGYDPAIENKSNSPHQNVGKYADARRMADELMERLKLNYEYVGTPDAIRDNGNTAT
jgi:hypothetical protein